jgi:hypothetical protein
VSRVIFIFQDLRVAFEFWKSVSQIVMRIARALEADDIISSIDDANEFLEKKKKAIGFY